MLIKLDQRIDEAGWHSWRNDAGDGFPRITATRAVTLSGFNPYKTAWREMAEMMGKVAPEDLSKVPAVQRGVQYEPHAVAWLSQKKGVVLESGFCFESDDFPEFASTPDSILLNSDQRVTYIGEIKIPGESVMKEVVSLKEKSIAYDYYRHQVIWQMGTCSLSDAEEGRISADLCFYNIEEPDDSIVLPVNFDLAAWNSMVDMSVKCRQALILGEFPDEFFPDFYIPDTEEADAEWQALSFEAFEIEDQSAELKAKIKALDARRDEIQDRMVLLMGKKDKADAYGVKVTRYLQQGSIDWKAALKTLDPSLTDAKYEAFRKESSQRIRMTVKKV